MKKCKQCKQPFEPQRPLQYVCSIPCSYEYSKKLQEKKEKEKFKELKEKCKQKRDFLNDLQNEINTIVRLIDNNQPCIATGLNNGKRNAGHYISRGSNPTIRFNLHNIHIQSEHSNSYKAGDTTRYKEGIINIYGADYLEFMDSLQQTPKLNLSIDEIKLAIKEARAIVKELKSDDLTYSVEERKELREKFNKRIGIY